MASTIDVTSPAQGSPLSSASVRDNFAAAANDITTLQTEVTALEQAGPGAGIPDVAAGQGLSVRQNGSWHPLPGLYLGNTGQLDWSSPMYMSGGLHVRGQLTQSGGDMYVSGHQLWLYPNSNLYIGNSDVYLSTRLYSSGGASFYGGTMYISGYDLRISSYTRFSGSSVYFSGGADINITSRFGLSGGAHYIESGHGWDPSWSTASFCGSVFDLVKSRWGPQWYQQSTDLYLRWPMQIYCGGQLNLSGFFYCSGGAGFTRDVSISGDYLNINCDMNIWGGYTTRFSGGDVYFSGDAGVNITSRLAVSGGVNQNGHYIETGWSWNSPTFASFCGSALRIETYRGGAPSYHSYKTMYIYGVDTYWGYGGIYISGQMYCSGGMNISNWLSVSCQTTISGYESQLLRLDNSMSPGGYAIYIGQGDAWKPGGGTWAGTSDARTKTDIRNYEAGLKELMQLDAQTFRYNGRGRIRETGKRFVSIAAEQAQEVMPEMVEKVKGKLEYDDEEETEILQLNATPLIYASLNAIKEIAKTLERIDERLTKLEEKNQ